MDRKPSLVLPQEMAGAVNLLAHPVAGAAAMSALGIGLASHAFGVWMGALSVASDISQRMFDAMSGDKAGGAVMAKAPAGKAQARAKAVMSEAHAYARDIAPANEAGPGKVARRPPAATMVKVQASTTPRPPVAMARPSAPDDLKAITGIGPKLEAVLNGLGIWTYDQIACWSVEDASWIEEYVGFSGRIARDGWINQATALSRQAKNAGSN